MATRRQFLQGVSTVGTLACTGKSLDSGVEPIGIRSAEPERWVPEETVNNIVFPSGIQVGDVMSTRGFVSIQTTETQVSWKLVEQTDDAWGDLSEGTESATEGVVQFTIVNLKPDTAYCLVCFSESGERSTVTRFRSALGDTDWRIVTFGAASCLGGNLPWQTLTRAAEEKLDFFLLLGDTVYTNARNDSTARNDWKWALKVEGMEDLTQSTSIIATWDDHELVNNFDWDLVENPSEVFENAWRAFQNSVPMDKEQTGKMYRRISHGSVCDVFVLDCRGERRSSSGLYISVEQMDWLKTALSASSARFKFVMNSVPIIDFTDLIGEVEAIDRWQGFPEQRTEILSYIEDNGIEGVIWLSGDFHFGLVAQVSPTGAIGDTMMEVLNGPTGSFINIMGELMVPTEQYQDAVATWTYTKYMCNPQTGEVQVQFIDDSGDVLLERSLLL